MEEEEKIIEEQPVVDMHKGKSFCKKCQKWMKDTHFYTYPNGLKMELCKDCLTMHVDSFKPETFLWILEKLDVAYIPEHWNKCRDKVFQSHPEKVNGPSVLGRYLSLMKLSQNKDKKWKDTQDLFAQEPSEETEQMINELKEQLDNGEISEAQYKTLMPTEVQYQDFVENSAMQEIKEAVSKGQNLEALMNKKENPAVQGITEEQQAMASFDGEYLQEEELADPSLELSKEDKLYLAMKWGRLYKPNEWIQLEQHYNEMKESFDIQDADTERQLIVVCKTYLKMNQALDSGDIESYRKLSTVYEAQRKSSKFTAIQNKIQDSNTIDAVGKLVAFCEKEGGAIPKFELTVERDIVDQVINNMKEYVRDLIDGDKALSRQIEDYIRKREILEEQEKERKRAKELGLEGIEITDEEVMQHVEKIRKEKEIDAVIQKMEDVEE